MIRDRSTRGDVLLVGPSLDDQGGVTAVCLAYRAGGLFEERPGDPRIRHFASTRERSALRKLVFNGWRLLAFLLTPLARPALVHLHAGRSASFWRKAAYAWAARSRRARVLLHIHPAAFWDFHDAAAPWASRLIHATLRRADRVLVLTEPFAARLRRAAPGLRVEVLPNPVDLTSLDLEPPPPRSSDLVVYLGWLVPEKGVHDLLEAFAILRSSRPGARLVLAGSHGEREVSARMARLGLDDGSARLAGWLDRRGVAELLHACAAFVLASHSEGMPMALLEAMACGAPIVTCPVGGIPEIARDGRNALFVRPGDVAGLASALDRLLGDEPLREAMSRANREQVRAYDAVRIAGRLRAIYREVLGDA